MTSYKFYSFFLLELYLFGFVFSDICFVKNEEGIPRATLYNKAFKVCCGDSLAQKTQNLGCCGGNELYYTDKKSCCGGVLFPKSDNRICCSGNWIQLSKTEANMRDFLNCCGSKVYDPHIKICCNKTISDRKREEGCCNNEKINLRIHSCIKNIKVGKNEGFCGGHVYNKLKDTCCYETLVKGKAELVRTAGLYIPDPKAECCGNSIINNQESYCCHKRFYRYPTHSIPNNEDLRCCGYGYYNWTSQFCIDGNVKDKSPNTSLCGKEIINTIFQGCCANKIPFDLKSQKCCEGASYCVIDKSEDCCNGFQMRKGEICCQDIKPCVKGNETDNNCCFDFGEYQGQTYNDKRAACFHGKLYHLPEPEYQPCGTNAVYNPSNQFCCGDKVYNHGDGQCCGRSYWKIPPEQGRCCIMDNQVYTDDKTNPCIEKCGDEQFYDISTELCCEGRVFNYTGYNYCCGPYAVDPQTQGCCGNHFPYRKKSRKECCHDRQVYSKKYSRCDESGKVESIGDLENLLDVERICHPSGTKIFDGALQKVCTTNYAIVGKVVDIRSYFEREDSFQVRISLNRVKDLRNNSDVTFPRRLHFIVNIPSTPNDCPTTDLKKLKKVIVLFDDNIKGNKVKISPHSHFFFTRKTFMRTYAVTKAVTKSFCKIFL